MQVEGGRGFVEKHEAWVAHQHLRHRHQLALSAGKLVEVARGNRVQAQRVQHLTGARNRVLAGLTACRDQHGLKRPQRGRTREILRHVADELPAALAARGRAIDAEIHVSVAAAVHAGQGLNKRGLAGGIRPQQSHQLPAVEFFHIHGLQHAVLAIGRTQPGNSQFYVHSALLRVITMAMKNGTPRSEVTIPMGMARPGLIIRLTACAAHITAAPAAMEAGKK